MQNNDHDKLSVVVWSSEWFHIVRMWSQTHLRTSELMLSRGMRVFQYLLTHRGQYSFSQLFGIPYPVNTTLSFWLLTFDYAALQIVHCWSINYPLSSDLIIWPLSLIRQVGVCHADDLLYLWEPVFISAPFNEEVNLEIGPIFCPSIQTCPSYS